MGKTFGWTENAIAQGFEDNHLHFLRAGFKIEDGDAGYKISRLPMIILGSGGAKSVLAGFQYNCITDDRVKRALTDSRDNQINKLKDLAQIATEGGNLEGILKDAKVLNEPIGLRGIYEEAHDTMSKFGTPVTKDKFHPTQVTRIRSPGLPSGKKLAGSSTRVRNLKCIWTCYTQTSMVHYFMPHTAEGESSRWDVVMVQDSQALDIRRREKLVSKQGNLNFLVDLLVTQINSYLSSPHSKLALKSDERTSGVAAIYENEAKDALKNFLKRVGAKGRDDPIYTHFKGKLDTVYFTQVTIAWLLGESTIAWINPLYKFCTETNGLYARVALKKPFCPTSTDVKRWCIAKEQSTLVHT